MDCTEEFFRSIPVRISCAVVRSRQPYLILHLCRCLFPVPAHPPTPSHPHSCMCSNGTTNETTGCTTHNEQPVRGILQGVWAVRSPLPRHLCAPVGTACTAALPVAGAVVPMAQLRAPLPHTHTHTNTHTHTHTHSLHSSVCALAAHTISLQTNRAPCAAGPPHASVSGCGP